MGKCMRNGFVDLKEDLLGDMDGQALLHQNRAMVLVEHPMNCSEYQTNFIRQ